ncbi:unnamed protein product [Lactuca saligna]|uniref:Ubiquitin-like domain-containing protein n=1 Tax=Lactuca saligna TaxID=75948 RepID=A0AA35Z041_LACSI|nr:unnamed protein product [Lactuca saligna]
MHPKETKLTPLNYYMYVLFGSPHFYPLYITTPTPKFYINTTLLLISQKTTKRHKQMMKLKSKRLYRSFSRLRSGSSGGVSGGSGGSNCDGEKRGNTTVMGSMDEVKWELRPGGMLVQVRRDVAGGESVTEGIIIVRVTTVSQWHDISIRATSTFGLEAREQRLLFKGKEREDAEHLHMVGVRDNDKVLLLQDPAIKERKRLGLNKPPLYRTITV